MRWDDVRHLAAFAAEGSLAAAARQLGTEHATVARRIAQLEQRLNLKLLDRRGRTVCLTADGERLAAIGRSIAGEMLRLERLAGGARSEVAGEVVLSAPPAYAAIVLAPKLADLAERHPRLRITLLGETRSASLERREADLAVRLSRPTGADLIASKLGELSFRPYATEAYLQRHSESERRPVGSAGALAAAPQQKALDDLLVSKARVLADDVLIQAALAAAGAGVAMLPAFIASRHPELVPLAAGGVSFTRNIWLVVHRDVRNAVHIRTVIDRLKPPGPQLV